MSKPAIRIEGLWKEYVLGHGHARHDTFYELLTSTLKEPLRRLRRLGGLAEDEERFWALQDVNLEVQPGEVIGIIGRNGAGKSTLLKILSRITAPTRGRIELRGRLASLLEVGTGFHPELSGRENIFLNATILGMGQTEIGRKFDDIVEFSGVGKFLDTPVKRYSSGMYVRLAFSVAAHVDADILLVDEVLAVGDAEFQKRCLGMMGDVARRGRTVLFVSHNLTALRNLCNTGLLLDSGRSKAFGSIGDVLNEYASNRGKGNEMSVELVDEHSDKPARIQRISIVPIMAHGSHHLSVNTTFKIRTRVEVREPELDISVFLHLHDSSQNRVFSTGSFFNPQLNGRRLSPGIHEFDCVVPGRLLNDGDYTLDLMLMRDRYDLVETEAAILTIRIHDEPLGVEGWNWPVVGVIRPNLEWTHAAKADVASDNHAAIAPATQNAAGT